MVGGLLLFFLPVDLKKSKMTLSWQEGMAGIDWGRCCSLAADWQWAD